MEFNILKTADLGQIPDNVSADNNFLPKEVSAKIVEEITAANIMRQYVQRLTVANRSLSVPRINYGDTVNAYKVAYGTDIRTGNSETAFATNATVLEPQLLTAFTNVLESDLETAGMDLSNYIRKSLALTLARAEERGMLVGVKGAGAGYATMFDGLYTIAAGANCAQTPVEYEDADSLVDKISDAIKGQGVYGEDRGMLVCIAANTFANRLRKDSKIQQVGTYNVAELGVTRSGTLPLIHGVKIIESSVLETVEDGECAVLARVDGGILGERGGIIFRKKAIEEAFMQLLIMAEVIDFKWSLYNSAEKATGLTLIHKASS